MKAQKVAKESLSVVRFDLLSYSRNFPTLMQSFRLKGLGKQQRQASCKLGGGGGGGGWQVGKNTSCNLATASSVVVDGNTPLTKGNYLKIELRVNTFVRLVTCSISWLAK